MSSIHRHQRFASGFKYYIALCEGSGAGEALPFDMLYWPACSSQNTLGNKEFDVEDFYVSGPTKLKFETQPLSTKKNTNFTVKVQLLDGFGNVMTIDRHADILGPLSLADGNGGS